MAASTSSNDARFRLYTFSGLLCLWLLVICLRLVYLQIFCYGDFERRAQHQQQRSFDLSAKRGVIYDRAGRELAMSIQVDSAFVVPSEAPDLRQHHQPDHTHYERRSARCRWPIAARTRPSAGWRARPTPRWLTASAR